MTDDQKAAAIKDAVAGATKLKPTFTGNSEQRKRLWRLAVWAALEPVIRAEAEASVKSDS